MSVGRDVLPRSLTAELRAGAAPSGCAGPRARATGIDPGLATSEPEVELREVFATVADSGPTGRAPLHPDAGHSTIPLVRPPAAADAVRDLQARLDGHP